MDIQEYREKRGELTAVLKAQGKEMLLSGFQKFFGEMNIYAVTWTQGTPGFNDGDPCVFGVDEFSIFETEEDYLENPTEGKIWFRDSPQAVQDLQSIFELEEAFEEVFGDDVRVTVFRNGRVEVEDWYGHY